MKIHKKRMLLLPALLACLDLFLAGRSTAQTFTNLHSFAAGTGSYPIVNNSEGAFPYAGVMLTGNTLYGTTWKGGTNGTGAVFKINTDGTSFATLHSFGAITGGDTPYNSDGVYPQGDLTVAGSAVFGMAWACGPNGSGTVFAINTNGGGFTNTYNFTLSPPNINTNLDGGYPIAGLILSGNTLYGTASSAGTSGNGTVFAVNSDGSGFRTLHNFSGAVGNAGYLGHGINSDGLGPTAGLVLSGSTLYGTAYRGGGTAGNGTIFAVSTNAHDTEFTNLYSFTAVSGSSATNSDGSNPYAGLIISGNTLYGTALYGGSSGNGTVFKINTDGTGFTNLHNFGSDGSQPYGGVVLSGNTLYGTTYSGGSHNGGTIFAVQTDGSGFTNLYNFAGFYGDGANPHAGLFLSGNTLYGTTARGSTNGNGMVFSLTLPPGLPQLTMIRSGTNVILTWPVGFSGFALQSATNLAAPVWLPVTGQNPVTNPISGSRKFYRLSQ